MKIMSTKNIVNHTCVLDYKYNSANGLDNEMKADVKKLDFRNKDWLDRIDTDKEFNKTMHEFSKLMQEHKINHGVQTKLLVPFMRFHSKIRERQKG